jgi:bile acid-coenzyme A ligase
MAQMPMGRAYSWLAEQDPERPAVTHEGTTVSRRELDLASNRLARAYASLGVGQDDIVTVALPNSIEAYVAYAAIWKLGATPAPISARLPFVERDAIVTLANPALIVGVAPGTHGDRPSVPAGFTPDPSLSDAPLPECAAKHWKAPTSGGSTGRPKIIVAGAPAVIDPETAGGFGQVTNGVQLVPGPLYHNAPFQFSTRGLMTGNHLVVMTRFDAEEALKLIERHRVNWALMVPTMMHRIWRLGDSIRSRYDIGSLTGILHLAAPCPVWLKEAWIEWLGGERVWELYAGTESQGVTIIRGDEWLAHKGSVGKPADGTMRILDENGVDCPPNVVGEVYMKPRGQTYHYIGATAKRTDDGWETLGDMGRFDEDGYLYLADRQTDMILSGGANVYPAEVEAVLDAFPGVRSSCVVGLPDDDLGNRVHAIVDTAGRTLDMAALEHFLHDQLARYKHPRSFEFVDEPLRDDAGKVRRSALRAARVEPSVR